MNKAKMVPVLVFFLMIVGCASTLSEKDTVYPTVPGFSGKANEQLTTFFNQVQDEKGRRVAVFDGDGTVLGQVPHYLADECLYMYAKDHPERKPGLIKEMKNQSNVSLPYVQNRVHFFAGNSVESLRSLGDSCFHQYYAGKIFEPMRKLIQLLKDNGFEIWVVTASPETMYQRFLSRELRIPFTHIVGVKSVTRGGIITHEIIPPVPQDHGKKEAIETFIQEQPLLVAGNSRGDKEMIEYSRGLRIIVNPDEHIAPDQKESIADYARRNNWLIVRIRDVPEPGFPAVSSRTYGVRLNKTRDKSE